MTVGAAAGQGFSVTSFRDPSGCLLASASSVLRIVYESGQEDLKAFLASGVARQRMTSGAIVSTRILDGAAELSAIEAEPRLRLILDAHPGRVLLQHERISFPTFPYEWAPEMLHAAGEFTLDLARDLLREGLGLKDATPYNILFRGPKPVFIDVLSFERRDPRDPAWLPYAQFVRTFALPLLVNRVFGMPLDQIFTTRRDGLEPEEVYRWASPLRRVLPPFLSLVSMPAWLSGRGSQDDTSIYRKHRVGSPEKARFILESLLGGLRRTLRRLAPPAVKASVWSGYMDCNNYSREHFAAKERFVFEALRELAPGSLLDVGCNTGHFSMQAARNGASVVAIDYDPAVVGAVWRQARSEGLNVLPLVVNLTRPSPGVGWCNRECPSFLDRTRGAFDGILMLAVVHHMLVTERVPLPDIIDMAAELTNGWALIEFVAPEDSMFRRLTRGRENLHADLNVSVFEAQCLRRFHVVRTQHLEGTHRWLYLLRRAA